MRLRQLIGVLVIGVLIGLSGAPSVAHADDFLIGSDPQPKQELKETPGWVTLAFRSKSTAKLAKIVVLDAGGKNVTSGALIVEGTNVTTQLQFNLPRGTYSVYYRTSDSAGKPRGGAFQFAYGQGRWTALDKEVWVGEAEEPPIIKNPDPNSSMPGRATESPTVEPTGTPTKKATAKPSGSATAIESTSATATPSSEGGTSPTGWLIGAGVTVAALLAAAAVLFVRRNRGGGAPTGGGDGA